MPLSITTVAPAQSVVQAKLDLDAKRVAEATAQDINNLWATVQQIITTGTGISGTALPATPSTLP